MGVRRSALKLEPPGLNGKVQDFRKALRNPQSDPLPLAQELYRIATCDGRVDAALRGAGTRTAMWLLDGSLRYIPVGALHDGEHWLVERYRNVVITLSSSHGIEKVQTRYGMGWASAYRHRTC